MFSPQDIGQRKTPEVNETAPYLKDTDQRWFSEVADLYPSRGMSVWDGTGYAPEPAMVRKLASRFLEAQAVDRLTRRFLDS